MMEVSIPVNTYMIIISLISINGIAGFILHRKYLNSLGKHFDMIKNSSKMESVKNAAYLSKFECCCAFLFHTIFAIPIYILYKVLSVTFRVITLPATKKSVLSAEKTRRKHDHLFFNHNQCSQIESPGCCGFILTIGLILSIAIYYIFNRYN